MKNLNKFTKAELISKFQRLESKNSDQIINNQTLFNRLVDLILYFKALLIKITLISILIKTFKKYSLFAKVLRFTNWIILTIFGISLIDNFNLDFFKEIRYVLAGIVTYFSNTHFYSFLASIFKTNEEVTKPKISIRENPMSWESSRNESEIKQSKGNSKISEWLKPEPEVKPEESSNTKYYIIAGIIIGCLAAYYWGDITPIIKNLYDRIKPKKDGGDNQPSLEGYNRPSVEQRLLDIFNKDKEFNSDVSQIDLQDNTATGSNVKLEDVSNTQSSNNSMDQYFTKPIKPLEEQPTGLRPITGQNFSGESTDLLNEITTFLNYYDTATFPKPEIESGFYRLLRERLSTLSDLRRNSYEQLIQNDEINNKINRFLDLENQYYSPHIDSNKLDNILETQSDTYEEVAAANIESRMAWSDRATPSVQSPNSVASPLIEENNLVQTPLIQSQVLSHANSPENLDNNQLSNLIVNANDLNDNDLMSAVKETFDQDIGLKIDTSDTNIPSTSQNLPNINIDSNSSSDNSMNQYFTKPDQDVKPQYTFNDLLNAIKARRDDSNVVGSPQITQLGLSPKLSPLNTKPSISNLFDDTTALFEDQDDDLIPSISNIDKGKAKEIDTNILSNVINPWDNVKTNIHIGNSPNNIVVDLEYGSLWQRISKFKFVLNNDQIIEYNYAPNGVLKYNTFDLTSKIEANNIDNVELNKIIILDLNGDSYTVWKS